LVSSELVITEVPRALRRIAATDRRLDLTKCLRKADTLLEVIVLHAVYRATLRQAGMRFEPHLRSLDAIHVMEALRLRPIEAFMTYDKRQAAAARRAGLPTVSPGMKG
jgi:predicted nucleic acid-binding protein